jgi:hypothetical protein
MTFTAVLLLILFSVQEAYCAKVACNLDFPNWKQPLMYDLSDREMIVGTIYPDVFMVIDKKDTYVSGRLMREGTS